MSTSARITILALILLFAWFIVYWAWIAPDGGSSDEAMNSNSAELTLAPGDTVGQRPEGLAPGETAPDRGEIGGGNLRGGNNRNAAGNPMGLDLNPPPGGGRNTTTRADADDRAGGGDGNDSANTSPGPIVLPRGSSDVEDGGEEITESETGDVPIDGLTGTGGAADGGTDDGSGNDSGGDESGGDDGSGGALPAPPPTVPYDVQKGDTMQKIAKMWFGDYDKWVLIAYENPLVDPLKLKAGQTLRLPAKNAEVKDLPADMLAELTKNVDYVVGRNDTLSGIAKQFYGKATLWQIIWDANRDVIPDPNRMRAGITIKVPAYQIPAE